MTQVAWQDQYNIALVPDTTSYPSFYGTDAGIEGVFASDDGLTNKFRVPMKGHPHVRPSSGSINIEQATGSAEPQSTEFVTAAADPPGVQFTTPVNQYLLSLSLGMLLQNGVTEDPPSGGVVSCAYAPYTSADLNKYVGIVRTLVPSTTTIVTDALSHVLRGAVAQSITITGEERADLEMVTEFIGHAWNVAATNVPAVTTTTWGNLTMANTGSFVKFEDISMQITPTGTTTAIAFKTPSFNITLSNDLNAQFYNSSTIQKILLGRFTGEGSYVVPWGATTVGENDPLTDFAAGNISKLEVYKGSATPTTDGQFVTTLNTRPTDTDMQAEGEIGTVISYSIVTDSSTNAFSSTVVYADTTDRGW